jgi:hypothetical protein
MSPPEELKTKEESKVETNILGTRALEKELKEATFSIFSDITDLGYFSWEPTGPYKKLVHASAQGIRHYLRYDGQPLKVEPVSALQKRCPLKLMKLPPIGKDAKYPYDTPLIAALHVMLQTKRRETYDDIDFVFFGSPILDLLATTKVDSNFDYVAQWIPGTKIIGVKAIRTTRKNLGAHQTQFEKLSFGKHLSAPVHFHSTFHMQVMTIGRENGEPEEGETATSKKVLFASECLVQDPSTGAPVEVKLMDATSAAKCMKTSFQMISCGSSTLYAGEVTKAVLTDVKKMSLSEVVAVGVSRPISRRRARNHNRNRRVNRVDDADKEEKKEEDHELKAREEIEPQDHDDDDEDKKEDEEGQDDDDEIVVGAGGVKEYEANILKGLGVLQKAVDDGLFQSGKLLHLGFYKGSLIVYPDSLFPSDPSIVPDLLQETPPETTAETPVEA